MYLIKLSRYEYLVKCIFIFTIDTVITLFYSIKTYFFYIKNNPSYIIVKNVFNKSFNWKIKLVT